MTRSAKSSVAMLGREPGEQRLRPRACTTRRDGARAAPAGASRSGRSQRRASRPRAARRRPSHVPRRKPAAPAPARGARRDNAVAPIPVHMPSYGRQVPIAGAMGNYLRAAVRRRRRREAQRPRRRHRRISRPRRPSRRSTSSTGSIDEVAGELHGTFDLVVVPSGTKLASVAVSGPSPAIAHLLDEAAEKLAGQARARRAPRPASESRARREALSRGPARAATRHVHARARVPRAGRRCRPELRRRLVRALARARLDRGRRVARARGDREGVGAAPPGPRKQLLGGHRSVPRRRSGPRCAACSSRSRRQSIRANSRELLLLPRRGELARRPPRCSLRLLQARTRDEIPTSGPRPCTRGSIAGRTPQRRAGELTSRPAAPSRRRSSSRSAATPELAEHGSGQFKLWSRARARPAVPTFPPRGSTAGTFAIADGARPRRPREGEGAVRARLSGSARCGEQGIRARCRSIPTTRSSRSVRSSSQPA